MFAPWRLAGGFIAPSPPRPRSASIANGEAFGPPRPRRCVLHDIALVEAEVQSAKPPSSEYFWLRRTCRRLCAFARPMKTFEESKH